VSALSGSSGPLHRTGRGPLRSVGGELNWRLPATPAFFDSVVFVCGGAALGQSPVKRCFLVA
jgi:hypothetical protein